ncbi:EipA family protein [Bosea sp. CRIB-10]|uniref:EipA family protein n=1 Tax=Bosea sp. CRIB-10 TaxID=378404 RepID=UPI000B83BD30|nr:EipA family protein [Bosea sp. CRIB-10]
MDRIAIAVQLSPGAAGLMSALRVIWSWPSLRVMLATLLAFVPNLVLAQGATTKGDIRAGQLPTSSRQDIFRFVEGVFDTASKTVSLPIERSLALFGEPNAYIIGGELSGSFVVGGRHGSGELRFSDGIPVPVSWSALSVGIGLGADYGRVIMLVYGLDRYEDVFGTYASLGGSAHFLAGANATILASSRARIVLISSGLGLRFSGDLSRIVIEPAGPPEQLRPPGRICATPADCPPPGR